MEQIYIKDSYYSMRFKNSECEDGFWQEIKNGIMNVAYEIDEQKRMYLAECIYDYMKIYDIIKKGRPMWDGKQKRYTHRGGCWIEGYYLADIENARRKALSIFFTLSPIHEYIECVPMTSKEVKAAGLDKIIA